MLRSGNFGGVTGRFGVVLPRAQLSSAPRCRVLRVGFPATGLWLSVWQRTTPPPPPFQATALCAHVFHLKAFRVAEAKGHPALRASSCSSGARIGRSGACSRLAALNMGGHESLGKARFLTSWRWQRSSALPALLIKIVFFCLLHLQGCVCSMVSRNITWERTFWICCSGIEGPA